MIYKDIKSVHKSQIIIDLPSKFADKQVEVIVIPYHPSKIADDDPVDLSWQQAFRSISQWEINEDQVKVTSWPIETF